MGNEESPALSRKRGLHRGSLMPKSMGNGDLVMSGQDGEEGY